jgi:hypothetical protein
MSYEKYLDDSPPPKKRPAILVWLRTMLSPAWPLVLLLALLSGLFVYKSLMSVDEANLLDEACIESCAPMEFTSRTKNVCYCADVENQRVRMRRASDGR